MIAVTVSTLNYLHLPLGLIAVLMFAVLGLARLGVSHRRIAIALSIALMIVATRLTWAVICGACIGCDPWWLEWFWICVPAP